MIGNGRKSAVASFETAGSAFLRLREESIGGIVLTTEDIANLLARVAQKDRQAFNILYENTKRKLFGVLVRLLKDSTEAEDALQEVYVRVWQRAPTYGASKISAMSWLIVIARNHAIDRLRSRRDGHIELDETIIVDSSPTPESLVLACSEYARIERGLGMLDPDKANAVRGAYLEGYSYQELADKHGVPLNTMRTWLRRSLLKLREILEE